MGCTERAHLAVAVVAGATDSCGSCPVRVASEEAASASARATVAQDGGANGAMGSGRWAVRLRVEAVGTATGMASGLRRPVSGVETSIF